LYTYNALKVFQSVRSSTGKHFVDVTGWYKSRCK